MLPWPYRRVIVEEFGRPGGGGVPRKTLLSCPTSTPAPNQNRPANSASGSSSNNP
jgi:hypothetical protein